MATLIGRNSLLSEEQSKVAHFGMYLGLTNDRRGAPNDKKRLLPRFAATVCPCKVRRGPALLLGRWLKTLCVRRRLPPSQAVLPIVILLASCVYGQTASTGALTGITLDPSGAVLPGVSIDLVNEETAETQSVRSDEEGLT